jgi:hypothetical protein
LSSTAPQAAKIDGPRRALITVSVMLASFRAGVKFRDTWSATLIVNNLTNKHAQLESMFTENEPQSDFTRIETNQPLTGGVDLTYRF